MEPLFRGDSAKLERAIGRLAIAWAVAEASLDTSVSYAHFATQQGNPDPTDKLPLNARAKVRYFRRSFKQLAQCQGSETQIDGFADEMLRLMDLRHWCIHGSIKDYHKDTVLTFRRLKRPDLQSHEHKTVTLQDIEHATADCLVLSANLGNFMFDPVGAISLDQIKDIYRRIGIELPL